MQITRDVRGARLLLFGRPLQPTSAGLGRPAWQEARIADIRKLMDHALARPSGNWFVLGETARLGRRPERAWVAGRELVLWRRGGELHAGPHACPHMGGPLSEGEVSGGALVCPWHALPLRPPGRGAFRTLPLHHDGVLTWVRFGPEVPEQPRPALPRRPDAAIVGVFRREAVCDPEDVVANRLEPWHGPHLHYHSFARLRVLALDEESMLLRVAYRVAGPFAVEVDTTFHCPEPRTIVATIVDGDGVGSIAETHATPLAPGRTLITEVVMATSDRTGFGVVRALGSRLLRPLLVRASGRLWVEDAAYAERVAWLRGQGSAAPTVRPAR